MIKNGKWTRILFLIIILLIGSAAGILIDRNFIPCREIKKEIRQKPPRFPTLEAIAEQLQLSDEQKTQIREIFETSEERMRLLHSQIHERVDSMRKQLINEITSVPNEQQTVLFEEIVRKHIEEKNKAFEEMRKNHSDYGQDKGEKQ